jgi:tRNA (guanine37-N1)-methyltransferase
VIGIRREQWCIRVHTSEAETVRRTLKERDLLDRTLKPERDGEFLLVPVTEQIEHAGRAAFEERPQPEALPRHELVGGIALLQERDVAGAERLLSARPSLHTVLYPESAVEGEFRTRHFALLAGEDTTRTRYVEYGLRFDIDLAVAYFSPRLANERRRVLGLMGEGERVFDLFAGVGPFAITLARKAEVVFASDINPGAVHLMVDNLRLNRVDNVVPVLADADRIGRVCTREWDRVIMNLPLMSARFLETAFDLCKEGGWIHFYALQSEEGEFLPRIAVYTDGAVHERVVRSYSPSQHHAVYDIEVRKSQ